MEALDRALDEGDLDRALELIEELLEERPGDVPLRSDRAAILLELGEVEEAAAELQDLLKAEGAGTEIRYNLGVCLMEMEDWAEAREMFLDGQEAAGDDRVELLQHLVVIDLELGDLDSAQARLVEWEQSDGPNADLWCLRGELAMVRDDPEGSRKAWEKALDLDPDHDAARSHLENLDSGTAHSE